MNTLRTLIPVLVIAFLCSSAGMAGDVGDPDTVIISGGPLIVDQSRPVYVTIVNDYPIAAYSLGFLVSTVDEGFARFDSAVYVGRMADPAIYAYRTIQPRNNDGTSPDTILVAGLALGTSLPLPPGDGAILELYYTGLSHGQIQFDSVFIPPAVHFDLIDLVGNPYPPKYVDMEISIGAGVAAPTMTLSQQSPQVTTGTEVEIEVQGNSSVGYPITLDLVSLVGYDDATQNPVSSPSFGSGNPATFSWTPAAGDAGIWKVTFRVCDSSGTCTDISTDIQVVESSDYLLSFDYSETTNSPDATGMLHGNFDGDQNPELFMTGTTYWETYSAALYDYSDENGFEQGGSYIDDDFPSRAPQLGYFNNDAYLDVVLIHNTPFINLAVLLGDGQNSFSTSISEDLSANIPKGAITGEFTRDGYIDYAMVQFNGVNIYAGGSSPLFQKAGFFGVSDTATSINTADFNGDGYADLAIGTREGVNIYLGDSQGGFDSAYFYSQLYGSLDIVVTNEGSDFNNDGEYDLCISTPSVGGAYSEMMVYLGNGDGSFDQTVVRTVKGQIFGNRVGDVNGDGELDIVYVNGALEYAAVLFGDGDGSFTNELRFDIPFRNPRYIDCFDVDLDGDIDIAVNANAFYPSNSLFLLTNQLDPPGFAPKSLVVTGCNNIELELASETGRVFNCNRNTMPTGQYFRRNLDQNEVIDEFAELSLVEEGAYTLTVMPKPNLAVGEPFTAEFTLDGELYRLARDLPMRAEGYNFTVYAADNSDVYPRPGKFVSVNPPTFFWVGDGDFDFQLASDINFNDLLYDVTVTGNNYALPSELETADEAAYYWRVKPHNQGAFDCLYVINMVSAEYSLCGDANEDGRLDVSDAVFIINMIFKNGSVPGSPCIADANGDGFGNVGDVVWMINFVFKGGFAPVDNCCQ